MPVSVCACLGREVDVADGTDALSRTASSAESLRGRSRGRRRERPSSAPHTHASSELRPALRKPVHLCTRLCPRQWASTKEEKKELCVHPPRCLLACNDFYFQRPPLPIALSRAALRCVAAVCVLEAAHNQVPRARSSAFFHLPFARRAWTYQAHNTYTRIRVLPPPPSRWSHSHIQTHTHAHTSSLIIISTPPLLPSLFPTHSACTPLACCSPPVLTRPHPPPPDPHRLTHTHAPSPR